MPTKGERPVKGTASAPGGRPLGWADVTPAERYALSLVDKRLRRFGEAQQKAIWATGSTPKNPPWPVDIWRLSLLRTLRSVWSPAFTPTDLASHPKLSKWYAEKPRLTTTSVEMWCRVPDAIERGFSARLERSRLARLLIDIETEVARSLRVALTADNTMQLRQIGLLPPTAKRLADPGVLERALTTKSRPEVALTAKSLSVLWAEFESGGATTSINSKAEAIYRTLRASNALSALGEKGAKARGKERYDFNLQTFLNGFYKDSLLRSISSGLSFPAFLKELTTRCSGPGRDDFEVDDGDIFWNDREGVSFRRKLSALRPYFRRAQKAIPHRGKRHVVNPRNT